jgi:hypothetical protein
MRKLIATACILCVLTLPANAMTTADVLQEKPVAPLSTTAIATIAPVIQAIMISGMDPAQKERSVQAIVEITKYELDVRAKTTESLAGKIFDISVKLISLAASVFAVIKVTS